ncbi:RNA-dependent ATPase, partial [Spiromyces aspiralis]
MPSVSSPARQKMASKPNKVKKGEKEPAKKVTKNKDKYDKEKRKELKKKRKHLQQEEDLKPEDHKPEQDDHGETEDAQQCKSKRSKLNDAASDPASPPHAKKSEGTATRITAEEARRYYEEHNIAVTIPDSGARKPYYPFTEFTMTNFDERILKACEGFTAPTPIQAACWPILTDGRDAVGIAETGS